MNQQPTHRGHVFTITSLGGVTKQKKTNYSSSFLFLGPAEPLSFAQRARHFSHGCGRNISLDTETGNSRLECGDDFLIILPGRLLGTSSLKSMTKRVKECSTSMKSCDMGRHVPRSPCLIRGLKI